MGLIPLDMELLISRDIGQSVEYTAQNGLNILDISLIDQLDQWIIFTIKVKANVSFSASR